MTVLSTNMPSFLSGMGTSITAFFAHLIENSAMAKQAEARSEQIHVLRAKSDAELAEMNLDRDDIVTYVFRDLMYI